MDKLYASYKPFWSFTSIVMRYDHYVTVTKLRTNLKMYTYHQPQKSLYTNGIRIQIKYYRNSPQGQCVLFKKQEVLFYRLEDKYIILWYSIYVLCLNKNILLIRYTKIRNIVNLEFISGFTYITMNLDTFIFHSNGNIISNCFV